MGLGGVAVRVVAIGAGDEVQGIAIVAGLEEIRSLLPVHASVLAVPVHSRAPEL
jgi:hypothetical protein